MNLDLATIVRATGAEVWRQTPGGDVTHNSLHTVDLEREFSPVVVDSREVEPGGFFIALPGERVHGEAFTDQAYEAGALGCMVAESSDPFAQLPREHASGSARYAFQVPETLPALQSLAAEWRRVLRPTVIGVTGSVGKTTTKEIVAGVLADSIPTFRSAANRNTEIGLPLELLQLRAWHQVAVCEMGMYAAGDIALLANIAQPSIGIVTNVAPIHLGRVGTIERIARAKSELVEALPSTGLAILNGDDPWTRAMAKTSGTARVSLVGTSSECDFRGENIRSLGLEGIALDVIAEHRRVSITSPIPGLHTLHAVLAAVAVARELEISWDQITASLGTLRLDVRQRILRAGNLVLIDDAYNASPLSVRASLDLLNECPGKKIAVLGDMLELGPAEQEAHQRVGERVAEVADWLIVRGERARWIAASAESHGFPADHVCRAESNSEAVNAVHRILGRFVPPSPTGGAPRMQRPEAIEPWSILVKGSRGMGMEEVVQGLGDWR
ncbi:MAG: UDP-N-acetylmuramoyl-tripeptide--D-alanyl-D-alanine ligase [Chloroflexota bacterium]